jgi:hypothetical protein
MYVMLVTCMGRVSCYSCLGQMVTFQLRVNWLSVRFLHILFALLHLIFRFVSFFIIFLYSLTPIQLAFYYNSLIIFLFFRLSLFHPPLFCWLLCLSFMFSPLLYAA